MSGKKSETNKNMGLAFFMNLGFAIIEIIGGYLTGSIAILSDAIHDFGDALSLGAGWYLERKSNKEANSKYTFGYGRFSLLGALLNAVVLMFGSLYVLIEAVKKLFHPGTPHAQGMIWLAILGILVNGYAAYRMTKGKRGLNQKVLSWHLIEDVLGWIAVLIVSIIMLFKNIPILDPLLSIGITIYVLSHVVKNLKKTLMLILDSVPENVPINDMEKDIKAIEGVSHVQDLRFWSVAEKQNAFTVLIVVPDDTEKNAITGIKKKVYDLVSSYDVAYKSIQIDYLGETSGN